MKTSFIAANRSRASLLDQLFKRSRALRFLPSMQGIDVEEGDEPFFCEVRTTGCYVWTSLGSGRQIDRLLIFAFGKDATPALLATTIELDAKGGIHSLAIQKLRPETAGQYEVLCMDMLVPHASEEVQELGAAVADRLIHDTLFYGQEVATEHWPAHFRQSATG